MRDFYFQLYNEDTHIMFDQFWLQAKKYVHPDSFQLAGSFEQIPDVAIYPNMTMCKIMYIFEESLEGGKTP